jgi:hypothetical protein
MVIGISLEYIIKKHTYNKQYHLQSDWHIKHNKNVDAVLVGNSRIYQMLNAEMLSKFTSNKHYALCQASRGSKVLYYKFVKFLEFNPNPENVYFQFDPYFCGKSLTRGTFNGKFSYLPYLYFNNLGINHLFEDEAGFSTFEVYLPLLRYFRSGVKGPYLMFLHLFQLEPYKKGFFEYGNEIQNKNWMASSSWEKPLKTDDIMDFSYVDSFRMLCKNRNIKLTLIYTPQSYPSYLMVDKRIIRELSNYAIINNIRFINFNNDSYNNKNLFYNHMHLNSRGSVIFTKSFLDSSKI